MSLIPHLGRTDPPYSRDFRREKTNFKGENFIKYDFSGMDFSDEDLTAVNLSGSNLSRANLSRTNLTRAKLWPVKKSSQHRQTGIVSKVEPKISDLVDLTGADLSEANLTEAELGGVILKGAILCGANLSKSNFSCKKFMWVDVEHSLPNSRVFISDLSGANMTGACLIEANLSYTKLINTNLTAADLRGADFTQAKLDGAIFSEAIYDENTKFPKGFDPKNKGIVLINSNSLLVNINQEQPIPKNPPTENLINSNTNQEDSPQGNLKIANISQEQPNHKNTQAENSISFNTDNEESQKWNSENLDSANQNTFKVSNKQISPEELQQNKEEAERVGHEGEKYINNYLQDLKENCKINSFKWVSNINATSPYDFWYINNNGVKILVDVKSTPGQFDNVIHISFSELRQIGYGDERYDLYRVFEIDENAKMLKLRIAENVKDFAISILQVFELLPEGVIANGISVSPSNPQLKFQSEAIPIKYS